MGQDTLRRDCSLRVETDKQGDAYTFVRSELSGSGKDKHPPQAQEVSEGFLEEVTSELSLGS